MRINRYIAQATSLSRRAADQAIAGSRVAVNGVIATAGQQIQPSDSVTLDNASISLDGKTTTMMLNKPAGYVCSRDGQGNKTIYDLLPPDLHKLKPVGRLDKDSSGLLLLTNDGKLAHELTHPSFQKEKLYDVAIDKPLKSEDKARIEAGVMLEDGKSSLRLTANSKQPKETLTYTIRIHEGRNRQIRRTFAALGYKVIKLHRTQFGPYELGALQSGKYKNS